MLSPQKQNDPNHYGLGHTKDLCRNGKGLANNISAASKAGEYSRIDDFAVELLPFDGQTLIHFSKLIIALRY